MTHLKQRLLGLFALLAIGLFVVGTPVLLLATDTTPSLPIDWNALGTLLTSPDDGTLALAVIGLVAWAAWLVMTTSLVLEVIAKVRGTRPRAMPGLQVPQLTARRLVALASLLFMAIPLSAPALTQAPAHADPSSELPRSTPEPSLAPHVARTPPSAQQVDLATVIEIEPATVQYTVKRGESLWSIARDRLGDGKRYVEIVELNTDVLNGRPDFITPGLVLHLPIEASETTDPQPPAGSVSESAAETYVVEPGDTLSEIALDELGDASLYPKIFDASRDTTQPDGAQLSDPNLIRPGWELTVPTHTAPKPGGVVEPEPDRAPPVDVAPPPNLPPTPSPASPAVEPHPAAPEPSESAASSPHADASDTDGEAGDDAAGEAGEDTPGWLLPGLAGAGAVLAGALLLTVRHHRSTQLRFRRPGHIIVPPPPELRAIEKAAHVIGTAMAPQVEKLDSVLRWLAATMIDPPSVVSVELTPNAVVLHLANAAHLPAPWNGAGTTWSLPLTTEVPAGVDELAPYPLLVTVGLSDNPDDPGDPGDGGGHLWLLNLEHFGIVTVTGDPDKAEAFGRSIAAELALNPWSALVDIDTVGLAAELAPIAPLRLHHHADGDVQFLDDLARDLDPDLGLPGLDPEHFYAVVHMNRNHETSHLAKVVTIITTHPGRAGAAVVAINGTPEPGAVVLDLTAEGRLVASGLELEVTAVGLTPAEAVACAAIVDLTRDAANAPVPVDATATEGLAALTDTAGALRPELVEARPAGESVPAGPDSLLPLATLQYADAAPTTEEDVAVLAPVTKPDSRTPVLQADPDLDKDVAAWFSRDCPLPRLTLLGPVKARAHGEAIATITRKPFYVELLAFVALQRCGATTDEVLEAFGLTKNRARVDLTALRSWLGPNPRTGRHHLPDARTTRAAKVRRVAAYQVEDVLIDLDLFRRLRARGQARGAAGIEDLTTALRLVTGEPFSDLRTPGWSWLLDGDRIDHIMTSAIVDVAHLVTTHALTVEDLDLARFAAETSCNAAPYDDIGRLDLVQVATLTGNTEQAERDLVDGVLNRSDDELGPVDLPERTARVVGQRTRKSRSRTTN